MEDRKVPWWRKALSFALSGFRSGFGLFSRTQKNDVDNEPGFVTGLEVNPKEEAELIKDSPKLETISEAETEGVAVIVVDAASSVEVDAETTVEEPFADAREPEVVEEAAAAPAAEVEVAAVIENEVETPELDSIEEAVSEPIVEHEAEAPGVEAVEDAIVEPAVQEAAEAAMIESETEAAAVQASESLEAYAERIEAVAEEVPAQTTEQTAEVERESVDEATPQAETPVKVEAFPEPADEPMDLKKSISEKSVEEAAPAEVAQTSEAAEEATSRDREPEAEATADPVAAVGEPIDATASAAETQETSGEAGEVAAEPASEPVAAAPAIVPGPASTQQAQEGDAEPAAASVQKAAAPQHPSKPFIKLESRDNEADLSAFSVIVSQVYDGPLDLLLDLIRKQDIDIYDIPIARITAQFLAYVNQLKATDVDVAGEFIYTASLLIHIKSKMLLPRAPAGPDDAAEDPRRELVERLLEHERFKNAAQMLQQKQMLEAASWTNPGMREFQDDAAAEPEITADTVDLVLVFPDILDRARNRPVINVEEDSVTVGQMIQFLARRLNMEDKPVALRRLLSHTRSERALIAMFLALLELVRLQAILLRQDRAFSEIFIKKHTGFEALMNEDLANARDDWR
jgi:segregation and condensation protein A